MNHTLYDLRTDEPLRPASKQEIRRFANAERIGAGILSVGGRRCYIQEG